MDLLPVSGKELEGVSGKEELDAGTADEFQEGVDEDPLPLHVERDLRLVYQEHAGGFPSGYDLSQQRE